MVIHFKTMTQSYWIQTQIVSKVYLQFGFKKAMEVIKSADVYREFMQVCFANEMMTVWC